MHCLCRTAPTFRAREHPLSIAPLPSVETVSGPLSTQAAEPQGRPWEGRSICRLCGVSGLLSAFVCKVKNKIAVFRVVKIETPEPGVRSLGPWTKLSNTPHPPDKIIADDQLTSSLSLQCQATWAYKMVSTQDEPGESEWTSAFSRCERAILTTVTDETHTEVFQSLATLIPASLVSAISPQN